MKGQFARLDKWLLRIVFYDLRDPRAVLSCGRVCKHWHAQSRENNSVAWRAHRARVLSRCPELEPLFVQLGTWRTFALHLLEPYESAFISATKKATRQMLVSAFFRTLLPERAIQSITVTIESPKWIAKNYFECLIVTAAPIVVEVEFWLPRCPERDYILFTIDPALYNVKECEISIPWRALILNDSNVAAYTEPNVFIFEESP